MLGAQCTTQTSTSHPTSTTARTHLQPPLPSRRHSRPPPAPPPPTPAPNHVDTDSRSPLDARFPPHGEDVWLTPPVPSQPWVPATPAPRVDPTVDVDELLQVFSGTGALATTGEVQFGLWER
ncbi:hypothetical protein M427DRAFT_284275 [Gonapodya prolifera JEL478]|uniref:Uncharacterized protein n=1 Tax=Gonapodya prolifera (strain JEL478) TaxID=1344416 RepID=A0A139AJ69_GONPJ|nr:hypothetical protein M427DRAFT_284275 [Gonapodya prolifera JEL478]|eukprot:KXS16779.1 hypothetical protein M427DRAFT_284275 [Gonapodya prolifera JEL478]